MLFTSSRRFSFLSSVGAVGSVSLLPSFSFSLSSHTPALSHSTPTPTPSISFFIISSFIILFSCSYLFIFLHLLFVLLLSYVFAFFIFFLLFPILLHLPLSFLLDSLIILHHFLLGSSSPTPTSCPSSFSFSYSTSIIITVPATIFFTFFSLSSSTLYPYCYSSLPIFITVGGRSWAAAVRRPTSGASAHSPGVAVSTRWDLCPLRSEESKWLAINPVINCECRILDTCVCLQFGSVGPMAITLCQSLGQNIGMLRNKERPAAGKT